MSLSQVALGDRRELASTAVIASHLVFRISADREMEGLMTRAIGDAERTAFAERGYVVLESVIDAHDLDMLRRECAVFVERTDAWLAERGTDVFGITHTVWRVRAVRKIQEIHVRQTFLRGVKNGQPAQSRIKDTYCHLPLQARCRSSNS